MRIDSAISLQRVGYTPGGVGVWPHGIRRPQPPIERRSAARALPPQRLGDAAQLTLLMTQSLAGGRERNTASAYAAYAEPADRETIFAFSV